MGKGVMGANIEGDKRHGEDDMGSLKPPVVGEEVAVRVILFNRSDEILLQRVAVPGKPDFFITPGGRLDDPSESLPAAVRREIQEETGFENFEIQSDKPVFSGSHVMEKRRGHVRMTEHFFVVKLNDSVDEIDARRQRLTEEEKQAFLGQEWFPLNDIASGEHIVVPVNLFDFAKACLGQQPVPDVDFSDPPEFSR